MTPPPPQARGPAAVLYLPASAAAAATRVVGRPAAYRTALTALRAGCPSVVLPASLQGTEMDRAMASSASARGRLVWHADDAPAPGGPVLLLPAGAVMPVEALRALLGAPPDAMLARAPDGAPDEAPVALASAATAAALPTAPDSALGPVLGRALRAAGAGLVPTPWCVLAVDERTGREAARHLYASRGSPVDSWLDRRLHRPLSGLITRAALALGVSANALSLLSVLIGLAAVWCWAQATLAAALGGLGLYLVSVVLDHADGEVARLGLGESRLGEWLDVTGDTVVHVLGAVALGAAAERAAGAGLAAGVVAALGFAASALVTKTGAPPADGDGVDRALAVIGTRDGYYLLLVLSMLALGLAPAALPALMTLAAASAHAYWISHLTVGLLRRGRARETGSRARRDRG